VLLHHKEIWSEGRLEAIAELPADDFVAHHPGAPDWNGHHDAEDIVRRTRAAFPDFNETVEDVMVDGDRVITRFVARGTHLGPYQGLAPTGKSFAMAATSLEDFEPTRIGGCHQGE
jgi:NTE family protein